MIEKNHFLYVSNDAAFRVNKRLMGGEGFLFSLTGYSAAKLRALRGAAQRAGLRWRFAMSHYPRRAMLLHRVVHF